MSRNQLAASGLAKCVRTACSASRPTSPTGIVASTSSQASRWSLVRTSRRAMLVTSPPMMRTQSRQK